MIRKYTHLFTRQAMWFPKNEKGDDGGGEAMGDGREREREGDTPRKWSLGCDWTIGYDIPGYDWIIGYG